MSLQKLARAVGEIVILRKVVTWDFSILSIYKKENKHLAINKWKIPNSSKLKIMDNELVFQSEILVGFEI